MMKTVFFLWILLVSCFVSAQDSIVSGIRFELESNILNEKRIIEIQLPQNYHNPDFAKADYPVVYVLDGEFNFSLVSALERFNTKFLYRPQPEMIVVGIKNSDRTRDFTPTKMTAEIGHKMNQFETSGGADAFIRFLENELKPFIHDQFRTNGYDLLVGHSFGGLFTLYAMIQRPALFDAYIVLDPSLWWDNKYVYNLAKEKWGSIDFKGKYLFVALAYESPENAADRFQHGHTIRDFCEKIIKSHPENNLQSYWKYYPDYDHGLVPVNGILDGLLAVFDGIQLPVKEIPGNPELIRETYRKLSDRLDFNFKPDESLLYELILYAQKIGNTENAQKIIHYSLALYPKSKQLNQLKQHYEQSSIQNKIKS